MKIKAKVKKDITKVKMLIKHPMETGRRKDEGGNVIPALYITQVSASYRGQRVFHAEVGQAVSKDPYIAFSFKGGLPGEKITITWLDISGATATGEAAIK
ncbi:thiosulfate oxidation carrier complex protein SoxZ [Gammaproteobacteria bacterium 53_120_T64]|nr:thiosulfate oxidation carrier complex protein SoxZ [Gammaproteobacteria bacterium 53_120_T64]